MTKAGGEDQELFKITIEMKERGRILKHSKNIAQRAKRLEYPSGLIRPLIVVTSRHQSCGMEWTIEYDVVQRKLVFK